VAATTARLHSCNGIHYHNNYDCNKATFHYRINHEVTETKNPLLKLLSPENVLLRTTLMAHSKASTAQAAQQNLYLQCSVKLMNLAPENVLLRTMLMAHRLSARLLQCVLDTFTSMNRASGKSLT
jgi:hypothetical protein